MTKYFDRSGIEVSLSAIQCVNDVKGTAEYTYRVVCNKCNGRGERNHFYKSRCMVCNATGYSLITTRTAYTLDALRRSYPAAARKVADAEFRAKQNAVQARYSQFSIWCETHQNLLDALTAHTVKNNFLDSLKHTLSRRHPLSDKQIAVAEKILGLK
ncbi:hypothetical protein I7V28_19250 [Lelliottia amnigena]|uniref:hypothetical protein n=1 Tax=Lelliottia amnigena TaxID=61646 RepID=UPI00192B875F|nr:hypothetical protein [Lelliottia amnigena]MBL5923220.1 hypothetical protein [Lelliottia amnigena]MBL5932130.1 hypothetical protein [Lelliottia amnigena]